MDVYYCFCKIINIIIVNIVLPRTSVMFSCTDKIDERKHEVSSTASSRKHVVGYVRGEACPTSLSRKVTLYLNLDSFL